jgi:predicted ATPase
LPAATTGKNHVQLDSRLFTTDSAQFETLLQHIDPESTPEHQIKQYEKALLLYRGELLPGMDDFWAVAERQTVSDRFVAGVRALSKLLITQGRHAEALEHVRRALQYEPLCEDLHRLLVRLLCALGHRSDALTEHSALVDRLKRDHGIAPSKKTQETIHQLLFSSTDKTDSLQRHNQPHSPIVVKKSSINSDSSLNPGPLFGRDEAVFEVSELLRAEDVRLLNLTGIGGAGKSRLALAVSRTVADKFGDSVWLVHLSDVIEPQTIEQTILRSMSIRVDARANVHTQLVDALNGKPCLLVLDNMEQLLPAGALVVKSLLEDVPELKCLVTSRQRLNISIERELPVTPLETPSKSGSPDRLIEFPSVQLFMHRASLVSHGFDITAENADVIAAICHHLEGLPLAIEMAAAWTRAMSPTEILDRLTPRLPLLVSRDADIVDRHASVRRTLECSYIQMPEHLRQLFIRLSVFRGGWSIEAAEAVGNSASVLMDLMDLRDRSLLRVPGNAEPNRNCYLEVVREYASELLHQSGEQDGVRRKHVGYFLQLAEKARPHLCGPEASIWLDILDLEQDNVRQALSWTLRSAGHHECSANSGMRICVALWRYWLQRGNLIEGLEWLREAESFDSHDNDILRANLKLGLGNLASTAGDYSRAQTALGDSVAIFRMVQDLSGESDALNGLGSLAFVQGDWRLSRSYYENALQLRKQQGDGRGEAAILSNLANVAARMGDTDTAMLYFERCLNILRETSDTHTLASVMVNSIPTLLMRDDVFEAERRLLTCIEISLSNGYPRVLAHCFEGVAEIYSRRARPRDAVVMFAVAASIRKRINAPLPASHRAVYATDYENLRNQLEQDVYGEAWIQGSHLSDAAAAAYCNISTSVQHERIPSRHN